MLRKDLLKVLSIILVCLFVFTACNDRFDLDKVRRYFNISKTEMSEQALTKRFDRDEELVETVRIAKAMYEHGQQVERFLDGERNSRKRTETVRALSSAVGMADRLLTALNIAGVSSYKIFPIPYLGFILTLGTQTWSLAVDVANRIEEDRYRSFLREYTIMRSYYGSGEECIEQIIQVTLHDNVTNESLGYDSVLIFYQSGLFPTLVRNATRGTGEDNFRQFLYSVEVDYSSYMFYKDRDALDAVKDLIISGESEHVIVERIPLGELPIGSRVADPTWEWEFRSGENYSYKSGDTARPVVWVVVSKNHYDGLGPHVVLLSEELIGIYTFDNSSRDDDPGFNHWGESGQQTTADKGLRPWLNSSGVHSGEGFYSAFPESFKSSIVTTSLPNRNWDDGSTYITEDIVFIPSTTELGDTTYEIGLFSKTYEIGTVYPYFSDGGEETRAARLNNTIWWYWTRSPNSYWAWSIFAVGSRGDFHTTVADYGTHGAVRPVVNLRADTMVLSTVNPDGVHEIMD